MPAEPAFISVDARFHEHYTALWAALERVFPVQFVADAPPAQAIGAIVFDDEPAADRAGPSLTLPLPDDRSTHGGVRVQTSALVPDTTLAAMDLIDAGEGMLPLRPATGEVVLAETDTGPVWLMTADSDVGPSFRCARPLPDLAHGAALRDHLTLGDFLGLVPLVLAIRSWLGPSGWTEPPLRATFLFDDINLHGRRYGFIPFQALADDGAEHGYHTIMATIPLDAWFTHPTARRVFGRDDVLSLVFHGNDHTTRELDSVESVDDALAKMAQGLRRITAFEAKSGLHVGRIMTPPHGACSSAVAEALFRLGYRSVCIEDVASWSAEPDPDPALHGWFPADFVAGGLPVVPRTLFDHDPRELAFRAFLRQPLVVYGHHEDLAEGLDLLRTFAAIVNRLGDVRWCDLDEMLDTNIATRVTDSTLHVRTYAGDATIDIPEGIDTVALQTPGVAGTLADTALSCDGAPVGFTSDAWQRVHVDRTAVAGDTTVATHIASTLPVEASAVPSPDRHPWPLVRRVLTETRDRGMPIAARARRPAARTP